MAKSDPKVSVDKNKQITKLEYGASGTYIVGGIITQVEHNPKLEGLRGIKIFDEMRKSDASIKASLRAMKLPILSANWYIESASEDERDQEVADFVENNLFKGMTITWREFLRQALTHLDFGFAVFEKVFELGEDGLIHWRKFAPRLQKSIYKWEMENGENGITQWLPNGKYVSIPIEKLLIFTNDKEGDNWAGISEIRSAFQPYTSKDMLYKVDRIAHERQGVGIPYVKLPPNADPSEEAEAEALVKNMYANEQAYLKYKEGWEFGFLDMKGSATRQQDRSILHHDRQISKNVLAPFLDLGSGNVGSYALSKDQSGLFLLGLESIAEHICEIVNVHAIKQLVDMNFNVEEYPELRFNKVGNTDHEKITASVQRGVASGTITPDKRLEAHLRDIMDLPELDEEEMAEKELAQFMQQQETEIQMMQTEEPEEAEPEVDENGVPMPKEDDVEAQEELFDTIFGAWGQAGKPLEDKHKEAIRQALLKYWASKGKGGKSKKGKGKKVKSPEQKNVEAQKKAAKAELKAYITEQRRTVLEKKVKGEKLSPEESAKMQLDLLNKRSEIEKKIESFDAQLEKFKASDRVDAIMAMKERIDHAITTIEQSA